MLKTMYAFLAIAVLAALAGYFIGNKNTPVEPVATEEEVMCTMDAFVCPDGTMVGRTGPNCEFVCPEAEVQVPLDIQNEIENKADMIRVSVPTLYTALVSPQIVKGQARGSWFHEASFPVVLVDWNGKIIAEATATAGENWLTDEFVNFSTVLTFANPYRLNDPEFMKRGAIIFRKANPSGLPENDEALEIPIRFAR